MPTSRQQKLTEEQVFEENNHDEHSVVVEEVGDEIASEAEVFSIWNTVLIRS